MPPRHERISLTQADLAANPLVWLAAVRPRILHPTRGYLRLDLPYRYQAGILVDRAPARCILKARQVGVSQLVALEALHTALYQPGATVLIVSRNLEAATNVLRYVKVALATPGLAAPEIVKNQETHLALANGASILSIPATRSAGRTYAATAVYLDEFAWMPWAQDIYQAVAPTVSHGGRLTVLSTPNGRANAFYLLWAGDWGGQFDRHTIPWYRCPPYNPTGWQLPDPAARAAGEAGPWYHAERPKFTSQQWAQEYGCDFIESGQAVFRAADIARATATPYPYPVPGPRPNHTYITFWDIGRRQDPTVGITLDITNLPWRIVAFDRFEAAPYPAIQAAIERRARTWPGRHIVESNGVGDPVIENLTVRVEPWLTTARSKQQMIQSLALRLERGEIIWPADLRQLTTEVALYQWDDAELVQDCVIALAGAVHNAGQPAPVAATAGRIVTATDLGL